MALVFTNGGGPSYLGFEFTNSTDLLTEIHTRLLAAGWTSITNTPGSGLIEMYCTSGSDNMSVRFETAQIVSTSYELLLTAGQGIGFTVTQPFRFAMPYEDTVINRLWICADQDHANICIQSFSGNTRGYHMGFHDRLDPVADPFGYSIGAIANFGMNNVILRNSANIAQPGHSSNRSSSGTSSTYFGKSIYDGLDWLPFCSEWSTNGDNPDTNATSDAMSYNGCIIGICSRFTTSLKGVTITSVASNNAGRNCTIGNTNGVNDKAVLGEFWKLEGRAQNQYATDAGEIFFGKPGYFRGIIKNCCVGMSHLLGGVQIVDTDGNRWLSVGDLRWQGMLVFKP